MDTGDLRTALAEWQRHMQAEHLSWHTVDSYVRGVGYYLDWCGERPPLDRRTLDGWVAHLLATGAQPATARIRQQAVRRFSAWLADEDIIDDDPFPGMRPPRLDVKVVQSLSEDELRLLLKACAGRALRDRRDEAILRLFVDTGMRARELLALNLTDLDQSRGLVTVRKGKGGKGRVVAFGARTGVALDRYLRVRRGHKLAATPALWLTETGGGDRLGYHGLRVGLLGRAQAAGVDGFHIHKLRHTFATRWLAKEGSEGGLMAAAGWSRRDMIDRYTAATASERAAAEAQRLNLGDL